MLSNFSSTLYPSTILKTMLINFTKAAAGAALITFSVGEVVQAATFEVLASGLDSPRGLSFGPDGALYVTEAGRGGTGACIPSPSLPDANLCYGATSAVTRIENGITERVVTGLPSLALPDGSDASGAHDIAFDSTGRAYVVVGLAGNPNDRDNLLGIADFGQLISIDDLNEGSAWTQVADLAAYEGLNNPDGGDIISNPYALLIQGDTAFVVDASANALLGVGIDGSELAVQSVFDTRPVTNPFGGLDIPMQSVPTSIAMSPDGAYYVGELTGFPFPEDAARVLRIEGEQPVVYADEFTNIIDLAFDPEGSLYVLEYAANSILSGDPTGELSRVAPDGTRTTIASEGLISPTGLALGPDGGIYISNNGFLAGQGQIIRIDPNDEPTSVPEPTSILGLLTLGAFGTVLQLFHFQKLSKWIGKKV
jgi:hypothetical protein